MSTDQEFSDISNFALRDNPTPAFIDYLRKRYPTERETDDLLVRKMQRRSGPPYQRASLDDMSRRLDRMLSEVITGDYEISEQGWFTGGVSKIQMGFTLRWNDPKRGERRERLVIRLDPSEASNTTSRLREYELIEAMTGLVPVPEVFWLDQEAKWFPEPALIYSYVPGVTKPTATATGKVSGLGTNFGPELRKLLAPQYLRHLGAIHSSDGSGKTLTSIDRPTVGTTENALWQLNRGRRIWEEDRGEDFPLVDVAFNWLERNMPTLDRVSVVHGDFRSGNFLFDEATGKINGWLDWERGHLGDRHRDLAWIIQKTLGHYSEDAKTYYVCGLIPLDEFYDRYEAASGLKVDQSKLAYYTILNCCQILASVMATGYRVARLGKSHQDVVLTRVKGMAPMVAKELSDLLKEWI